MTIAVALRARSAAGDDEDLTNLVDRIYQERGHMRNVTHESLQKEIEAANTASDASSDDEMQDGEQEEGAEARTKDLFTAKDEMVNLIGEASNEVLMLQDFMSLLISKDDPSAANSMSPALKEMVPVGTFSFDRNPVPRRSDTEIERLETETDGVCFDSLNATADKLLDSATRLEAEMTKETKYWDQILSVTEKGWNITRLRGSPHALGVRYACSEAAPQYQAAGQAQLRPSGDGGLTIDTGTSNATKCLRVRIKTGWQIVQTSKVPPLYEREDADLEHLVHQARDSLFDEELFQQLVTEARDLLAYDVKVKADTVHLPINTQPNEAMSKYDERNEVLIDLVDRETGSISDDGSDLAQGVALYLRLGLNHTYRERHRRRTQPPPPLSKKKDQHESSHLLKSMICLMRNYYATKRVQHGLGYRMLSCRSAGFNYMLEVRRQTVDSANHDRSSLDRLMGSAFGPQHTTTQFVMAPLPAIEVDITTNLGPAYYGTRFTLTAVASKLPAPKDQFFTDFNEFISSVEDIMSQSLSEHVARCIPGVEVRNNGSLQVRPDRYLKLTMSEGRLVLREGLAGQTGPIPIRGVWIGDQAIVRNKSGSMTLYDVLEAAVKAQENRVASE